MSLDQLHQDEIDVLQAYLEANHGDIKAVSKATGISARKLKELVAQWEQKAQQENEDGDADEDEDEDEANEAETLKLSYKQQLFVDAYLGQANGNATEAARLAGYKGTDNVLAVTGHENLRKPKISAWIDARLTDSGMSANEVLFRLAEQARASLDEFGTGLADRFVLDLGKAQRRGKIRLLKKLSYNNNGDPVLELHNSQAALKILAQYHGLLSASATMTLTPSLSASLRKLPRNDKHEMAERLQAEMEKTPDQHQALDPAEVETELKRCANDICYWVNTYGFTYDPREPDPVLPFKLFPMQEEFLRWLVAREMAQEDGLAEKCRDVGFSWLCSAYALHGWLFRKGFRCGIGSRKLELVDKIGDPKCLFEKIRFLLYHLPDWQHPEGYRTSSHDNHCRLVNPANGATISGEGGDDIGRGDRATVYIVDEHAFLEHADKVEAALSQTSRVKIRVSTPNGTGNAFYRLRHGGKVAVFTFPWKADPRKNAWELFEKATGRVVQRGNGEGLSLLPRNTDIRWPWYNRQVDTLDPITVAQEIDINYSASVDGICIPGTWVQAAVNLPLPGNGPKVGGLDVADGGRNKTVLITRQGPVVRDIEAWNVEALQAVYKARDAATDWRVAQLHYDAIGVGTNAKGIFNASEKRLPFTTHAIIGGDSPTETVWPDGKSSKERFHNLRAELWWLLRTRFQRAYEYRLFLNGHPDGKEHAAEDMISIPQHAQLISDLSLPLYLHTETGKIKIESKEAMQKRGVASPDYADALCYAFIVGKRQGSYISGGAPSGAGAVAQVKAGLAKQGGVFGQKGSYTPR